MDAITPVVMNFVFIYVATGFLTLTMMLIRQTRR